jgi:organic hydroperoxide reductase OsmC/OhrA
MAQEHRFACRTVWRGSMEEPIDSKSWKRDYVVEMTGKPDLAGSTSAAFFGDDSRHNPEDLLIAALSSCHMLSFLSAAARARLRILAYEDRAEAVLSLVERNFRFTSATLRPRITLARAEDLAKAREMNELARRICFVSNAVNFPVRDEAEFLVEGRA